MVGFLGEFDSPVSLSGTDDDPLLHQSSVTMARSAHASSPFGFRLFRITLASAIYKRGAGLGTLLRSFIFLRYKRLAHPECDVHA